MKLLLYATVSVFMYVSALSYEITLSELTTLGRNSPSNSAVLFHDSEADLQWWYDLDKEINSIDFYTFPIHGMLATYQMKLHRIEKTPTIKLFQKSTENSVVPLNPKHAHDWIALHTANVSMITKPLFSSFANGNTAVLVSQTRETCDTMLSTDRNPNLKYACYLEEKLMDGCDIIVFGKYMNAECVKTMDEQYNMTQIYKKLQKSVFPLLLSSSMMNDPLLFQLHPMRQSIFVLSDEPPHALNVSSDVHVIWEPLNTKMFGAEKPTVIRQDMWVWYAHELETGESIHYAVYDALKSTEPLNPARMFMAMQVNNFSRYFDPEWDNTMALKSFFPKRPKIPTFNFTKPKLPPLPNLTLSLEKDKEMAKKFGVDI